MTEQTSLEVAGKIVESFLANELRQINRLREEERQGDAHPQVEQAFELISQFLEIRLTRLRVTGIEPLPEPGNG